MFLSQNDAQNGIRPWGTCTKYEEHCDGRGRKPFSTAGAYSFFLIVKVIPILLINTLLLTPFLWLPQCYRGMVNIVWLLFQQ